MTIALYTDSPDLDQTMATILECVQAGDSWEVVPDCTVLYPEGGGQPSDAGTIDDVAVTALRKRKDGAIVHTVSRPLDGQVTIRLDRARRFDHSCQHTAQHLLTTLASRIFNYQTLSFHMAQDVCDLELGHTNIPPEHLMRLEDEANALILQDLQVTARWVSAEEYGRLDVRSRLLPKDLTGPFRLIEIEGVDLNTCGGTHVSRLGELQAIKLVGTERHTRGTRLFYIAGARVRRRFQEVLDRERAMSEVLSTGPTEQLASATAMTNELASLRRVNKALREDLAVYVSHDLAGRAVRPGDGQLAYVTYAHPDADVTHLREVATAVRALDPSLIVLGIGGATGAFVLVGPDGAVAAIGPKLAETLGGRGGGRGGVFQGRLTNSEGAEKVLEHEVKEWNSQN